MKWKGIVSQSGVSSIAMRLAKANATQATSIFLACSQPVTDIPHRLDWRLRSQLLAESADRYVDHIRAGVEVVSPHLREKLLATAHLPRVLQHEVEEPELPVGQLAQPSAEPCLALRHVEEQRSDLE